MILNFFIFFKLPGLNTNDVLDKKTKCPTVCDIDSSVTWISLFGVLIGLTFTVLVLVSSYMAYIEVKHQHFVKLSKT